MKFRRMSAATLGVFALGLAANAQTETEAKVQPASANDSVMAPDPLSSAAAVYATYHSDVTDVRHNSFKNSGDIQSALDNLGGQNSDQLTRGWMAYSALVASQNPEFRAAVRDIEGFYGKDVLVRGLQNDVRYARSLNGGTTAVKSSLSAIDSDAKRLRETAAFVKEQAYSLQGSGWAKGKVGDAGAIATRLRAESLNGRAASDAMMTTFSAPGIDSVLVNAGKSGGPSVWENISGAAKAVRVPDVSGALGISKSNVAKGKEPIADQIATLAAYRILGSEGASAAPMQSAMSEKQTASCINMAQLKLQACVAAAYQHFEVPFCIGEHALAEVGSCISNVSQ
ncbi:hypothetical protein [Henriciella aquimarina]|uniref:hypothetical protein n=1 Tax=Henriciella aquimarina TaxID=545261 RepID=UPI00117BC879|nr:hypothetical protein [Henriciella aquimarina]